MKGKHPLLLSLGLALAASPLAAADGGVVATIKPLHSIVQAVLGDTGEAQLLLTGRGSVHGVALKPSQARMLHNAELVFYIDEKLETFLPRQVRDSSAAQAAAGFPGVHLLPARGKDDHGGHDDHDDHDEHGHDDHDEHGHDDHDEHGHDDHDEHGHDDHDEHGHDDHDEHGHGDHDEHDHGIHDLHIWLDVDNAKAIARQVAQVLSAHAPQHAATYAKNAAALQQRLTALDAQLAQQLAAAAGVPYVVFHDAYQYVEKRYGLQPPVPLLMNPHLPPSARHLSEIRETIAKQGVRCAFSEPQFSSKPLQAIAGDTMRTGVLDPLGADIPAGEEMYFTLMKNLAEEMAGCLAGR